MNKLYVLVRRDLSKNQQAVQAGHAVASYLIHHPDTEWDNGTLVYLSVRDEQHLMDCWHKLRIHHSVSFFIEPDMNCEVTAIALVSKGDPVLESLSLTRL